MKHSSTFHVLYFAFKKGRWSGIWFLYIFSLFFCRPFLTPSLAVYSLLLDVAKHNK